MEIGLRAPGHAHLWVVLWSTRRMGRSSTTVPNLKRTALFVQKLYGSQHFETGSRNLGHAHLGVVLWSTRSRVRLLCLHEISSG